MVGRTVPGKTTIGNAASSALASAGGIIQIDDQSVGITDEQIGLQLLILEEQAMSAFKQLLVERPVLQRTNFKECFALWSFVVTLPREARRAGPARCPVPAIRTSSQPPTPRLPHPHHHQ
jgi:hypothetical protein